jgi:hypothetical protein
MSELGADAVLAPGRRDAAGLLAAWLLRRSTWPLFSLGVIAVVLTGTVDSPEQLGAQLDPQVSSVSDARARVGSPTTLLLLVAPAARLASGWLAWAIAFPLARRLQLELDQDLTRGRRHPLPWLDRARLASGLRTLRWTSSVRRRARGRLGRTGTVVQVAGVLLLIAGIVLFPAALIMLVSSLAS